MKIDINSKKIIRPWLISRLSLYWIPSFVILITLYNFIFIQKINFSTLLQNFSYAAVFIFGIEFWLFGERVILSNGYMQYRKRRWPFGKEIFIERENIIKIENVYFSKSKNIKASRFQIYLNKSNMPIDFVFASFKPSDVRFIIDWLGIKRP